jgi:hypothetical protein
MQILLLPSLFSRAFSFFLPFLSQYVCRRRHVHYPFLLLLLLLLV